MSKDNRVFLKSKSYLYLLPFKNVQVLASTKNTIYQHICMNKYILTVWSVSPLNAFRVIPGQAIMVRKVYIHAYSMYVLLADKVSCPITQRYDSGDSQISNPSIPSLTLYELSRCAS